MPINRFRDFAIDKDCPDYVKFQCPVCGLVTGEYGFHPPAKGVWVNGKPPEKEKIDANQ